MTAAGAGSDDAAPPLRRLVLCFVAVFAVLGVHVPFFPRWLQGRGFDAEATGAIVAAAILIRAGLAPWAGARADRGGFWDPRRLSIGLMLLAMIALTTLHGSVGLAGALLGAAVLGGAYGSVIPLLDSMVVLHARRAGGARIDYGRIRLWGSLSFLVVCVGAGAFLRGRSPEWVLTGLWVCLAGAVVSFLWLPAPPRPQAAAAPGGDTRPMAEVPSAEGRSAEGTSAEGGGALRWRAMLCDRRFLLLCAVAALIQGSHGCYYAFSVRHWSAAGVDEGAAGILWAEGVAAEILLFAFAGRRLVARPTTLFMIAAAAGVARWGVTALSTDPWAIASVQWLHAATFGLTHLGAIRWLSRNIADDNMSGAQTFLAAVAGGLGIGAVTWWSGSLYRDLGGGAFWVMAALAALGGVFALMLRRAHVTPAVLPSTDAAPAGASAEPRHPNGGR